LQTQRSGSNNEKSIVYKRTMKVDSNGVFQTVRRSVHGDGDSVYFQEMIDYYDNLKPIKKK
jgi:hypothetical protein